MVKKKKEHWVETLIKDKGYHNLSEEQQRDLDAFGDRIIAESRARKEAREQLKIDQINRKRNRTFLGVMIVLVLLVIIAG